MKAFSEAYKYDFHLSADNPLNVMYSMSPARKSESIPDMHYSLHLGILLDGSMNSLYENSQMRQNAGDFWLTAPWEPHATQRIGKPLEIVLLTILPEKLGDIGFNPGINWLLPFIVPAMDRPRATSKSMKKKIIELGREINEEWSRDNKYGKINCWLKLHELLLYIIDSSGFSQRPEIKIQNAALERILPAIELARATTNEQVSLETAAKACYLGKSRFSDLFKTAMGTSFGKFSKRVRVGAAAAEIAKNTLPVKDIAIKRGFYDESHFCRTFRQYFHCSPSEFRQKENK